MEQPRKLPSGRWQARYRDGLGIRRSAGTYDTRKEAQRAGVEAEELAAGSTMEPTITFAKYAPQVMRARKGTISDDSLRNMQRYVDAWLMPTFGKLRMTDIRYTTVMAWFNSLPETSGRRAAYMALSSILTHAHQDGLIRIKPVVKGAGRIVSPPRPYFTPEQVWQVIDRTPEPYRLLFTIQFGGGMRFSEALGLDWNAVDLDTGVVEIRQQYYKGHLKPHTKTKKPRRVMLADWAVEALREHRKTHPSIGAAPVFTDARGKRLSATKCYDAFKAAREEAGVDDITTHSLRKTDLTNYREVTGDMVKTMERAGHGDFRSALVYQHVEVEEDAAAVAQLSERTRRKSG